MTRELDTLLLETFAIEAGENVKYFSFSSKKGREYCCRENGRF